MHCFQQWCCVKVVSVASWLLQMHGQDWQQLAEAVPSKTEAQIKSYCQFVRGQVISWTPPHLLSFSQPVSASPKYVILLQEMHVKGEASVA